MLIRLWKTGLIFALLLSWNPAAAGMRLAVDAPAWSASTGLPDSTADRVLGQAGFNTNSPGTSATTLNGPAGIAVAPPTAPNAGRLFVAEYLNHRVLSWPSAAAFSNGQAADLVLGQADFTSGSGALAQNRFYGPEAAVVDASGSLWVADTENNRVLRFDPPFSDGMNASLVLGQPNFDTDNNPNQGGGVAANTLYYPRGLALDTAGNLYVADDANHRVLRFSPPFASNMEASLVIGQANFSSGDANRGGVAGQNTLYNPKGIAVDMVGNLYVAEYWNHRVTRYAPPLSDGMNASGVYGQPDFTTTDENYGGIGAGSLWKPIDIAVSPGGGTLFVTDQGNVRLLGYASPLSDLVADQVYGQPDFTSATPNNGGISATSINDEPLGVAVDASGNLYHADYQNNRLLAYDTDLQVVGDGTPGSCSEVALNAALVLGGTITFNCGTAQIDLSSTKVIAAAVTLDGGGAITLSGQAANRLFAVGSGAALTLQNIVLEDGYSSGDGGAIYNEGTLELENSTIRNSRSELSGGAIVNYGQLSVTNSLLEGNQALNGGALYPRWGGSQTSITNSVLRDNHATDTTNGWGGAILIWDGAGVTVTDSEISGNTAQSGGGIYNFANSALVLQLNTRVEGNTASLDGGGIYNDGLIVLDHAFIDANTADGGGGGLYNNTPGSIFFTNTSLSDNASTGHGSGLFNAGSAMLSNAILADNTSGASGGAVYNVAGLELTNATLSGNSADSHGGGLDNAGNAVLINVTISDNSAAVSGGGIFNIAGYNVNLKNSIVANSPLGGNCAGAALTTNNADKYSLSSDNTCALAGTGSQNGVDPMLTPLGDFGGDTLVQMLEIGSPAIDGVAGSDAPLIDQRNLPRPQGGGYDIGAVERQPGDTDLPPGLYLPLIIR